VRRDPFRGWRAERHTYEHLPQQPAEDDAVEHRIGYVQEQEERRLHEDGNNSGLMIGQSGSHMVGCIGHGLVVVVFSGRQGPAGSAVLKIVPRKQKVGARTLTPSS
jgi:hypothetical protein